MIPKIEMRMNIADMASKFHVVHAAMVLILPVWPPLLHVPFLLHILLSVTSNCYHSFQILKG